MKVILREDLINVGEAGATVNVADGYARNFLIPNGIAVPADENNVRSLEHERRLIERRLQREKGKAEELARRVEKISVSIACQAGEEGKLFGAVTAMDIQAELQKNGVSLERRQILLKEPIKTVGQHGVDLKLHRDVVVKVNVEVHAS